MQKFIILILFALANGAAAKTTIICSGWNGRKIPETIRIEETGKTVAPGYKLVDVKKVRLFPASNPIDRESGPTTPQLVEGCKEALMTGELYGRPTRNYTGNLSVECDGNGEAGSIELKKMSANTYKGKFFAPYGNHTMRLGYNGELELSCKIFREYVVISD